MTFSVFNLRTGQRVTHTSGGMGWPDVSEIFLRQDGTLYIREEYGEQTLDPREWRAEFYPAIEDTVIAQGSLLNPSTR
jgi:hypothetical protein